MATFTVSDFTGFEEGNDTDYDAEGGTRSVQSSVVRTGTYALQTNPTTTAVGYIALAGFSANGYTNNASIATSYSVLYFRYATKAATNDEQIAVVRASGGNEKLELRLDSSGNLAAYDSTLTIITTGSTTLNANTWYRVEIKCGTGTSADWEVKVDGVSEMSGTNNLGTGNATSLHIGKRNDRNGNTVDYFYDDVVFGSDDWIGEVKVLSLTPTANSASQADWTSGTGASDYQEVDEVPSDETDYIESTGAAGEEHRVTFESTSTVGISGAVHCLKAHVTFREASASSSSSLIRVHSSGSNDDTSATNTNTTWKHRWNLAQNDPNTSSPWSLSAVDSVEAGMVENNAPAVRCAFIRMHVLFNDVVPDFLPKLPLMGVG